MKIAIISSRNNIKWGGNEELWYWTALLAAREGHSVFVSVCDYLNNEERISTLRNAGVFVRLRNRHPVSSIKLVNYFKIKLRRLKNRIENPYVWLRHKKPDVIMVGQAGTFDYFNNTFLQEVVEILGKPLVINSQYLMEHLVLSEAQIKNARKLTANISKFIFVSQRNLENFKRMTCQRLDNAVVVQNPVKIKKIKMIPWAEQDCELAMVSVGRLFCQDKGQDILLQILSQEVWLRRNWKLSFYGEGPDEFYLKELVAIYRLQDRVQFCGFESDVLKIWSKNHLLVMPSFAEGTPLSLLEAISCGRPAVVSDVGGNSDFVVHNETGFVASVASVKSFGEAMELAWSKRLQMKELGDNALALAHRKINLTPEAEVLAVLASVVA